MSDEPTNLESILYFMDSTLGIPDFPITPMRSTGYRWNVPGR